MLSLYDRLRYTGQHWSFALNATVLQEAARLVTRTPHIVVPRARRNVVSRTVRRSPLRCGSSTNRSMPTI